MKIKVKCKADYDFYIDIKGILADTPIDVKNNLEKTTFIEGEIYVVENLTDLGLNLFALYDNGKVKYVSNSIFDKLFEVVEEQ